MIKRFTVGDLRITLTVARITKIIGVNSELEDGSHILMWDFDDVPLDDVKLELKKVQIRYFLSDIYILETKFQTNYIAYCFTAQCWRRAVEIIAQTNLVDWNFFKYGVYRGHFTLILHHSYATKLK
ncbi:unnamed protein product [marine sediment metagenome]|uniref:Uncharacterized protein n=1 Tax=marine sediment metagenome TaxID=412755 RepID=X1KLQ9_9ZZZZ